MGVIPLINPLPQGARRSFSGFVVLVAASMKDSERSPVILSEAKNLGRGPSQTLRRPDSIGAPQGDRNQRHLVNEALNQNNPREL